MQIVLNCDGGPEEIEAELCSLALLRGRTWWKSYISRRETLAARYDKALRPRYLAQTERFPHLWVIAGRPALRNSYISIWQSGASSLQPRVAPFSWFPKRMRQRNPKQQPPPRAVNLHLGASKMWPHSKSLPLWMPLFYAYGASSIVHDQCPILASWNWIQRRRRRSLYLTMFIPCEPQRAAGNAAMAGTQGTEGADIG